MVWSEGEKRDTFSGCENKKRMKWEEGGGKKWEIDVESGRLRESLSVSAYRSHADDDDESLVKLLT